MSRSHPLDDLSAAAAGCRDCDLWRNATQTVFGAGPATARLFLVGEQPGDQEDRAGEPFVGPAGKLLHRALADAGVPRQEVYLTNAVKHFKWATRGKRRIHEKPSAREMAACAHWLQAELAVVDPAVVVALGATAGRALLGPGFRVGQARGRTLELDGRPVVATTHPSAVLRARPAEARDAAYQGLVADLERAAQLERASV